LNFVEGLGGVAVTKAIDPLGDFDKALMMLEFLKILHSINHTMSNLLCVFGTSDLLIEAADRSRLITSSPSVDNGIQSNRISAYAFGSPIREG
jgi:hypothetical protein